MTICQSITITRFLAAECGLDGRDNLENAKIDEVVDAVSDLLSARVKLMIHINKRQNLALLFPTQNGFVFESDAKLKEEKMAKFKKETAPNALVRQDKTILSNSTK